MPGSTGLPVADLSSVLLPLLARILLFLMAFGLLSSLVTRWARSRRSQDAPNWITTWWGTGPARSGPSRTLRIGLGSLWIVDGLLQAQPRMPAGFIGQVIEPTYADAPSWLVHLVQPLERVWTAHPVAADATTVWIQLGLGVLILTGGRGGRLDRLALLASAVWGVTVWVAGEALGGLASPGASWLTGSPGAGSLYAITSIVLLLGARRTPEQIARSCRRCAGSWLLAAAVIQALPWEQNGTADGLTAPLHRAVQTNQPMVLLAPIRSTMRLIGQHPRPVDLGIISVLVVLGAGLWILSTRRPRVLRPLVALGILGCLATWWLAQDFGVLGGYGTDPNSGLPLAVLLLAGWPPKPRPVLAPSRVRSGARHEQLSLTATARTGVGAAGLAAVLAVPAVLVFIVLGPADAVAVKANSGGGLVALAGRQAPDFTLTDQTDRAITMRSVRGRITLVTFLDPMCSDDCPVIANQIATAVRGLGSVAGQVEILAVDTNPLFYRVSDVRAFTVAHGLSDLAQWHFVAGSAERLRELLAAYGVTVDVPAVGMVSHSEGIYFLDRTGAQVAYLGDGADENLATPYAAVIRGELSKLIG